MKWLATLLLLMTACAAPLPMTAPPVSATAAGEECECTPGPTPEPEPPAPEPEPPPPPAPTCKTPAPFYAALCMEDMESELNGYDPQRPNLGTLTRPVIAAQPDANLPRVEAANCAALNTALARGSVEVFMTGDCTTMVNGYSAVNVRLIGNGRLLNFVEYAHSSGRVAQRFAIHGARIGSIAVSQPGFPSDITIEGSRIDKAMMTTFAPGPAINVSTIAKIRRLLVVNTEIFGSRRGGDNTSAFLLSAEDVLFANVTGEAGSRANDDWFGRISGNPSSSVGEALRIWFIDFFGKSYGQKSIFRQGQAFGVVLSSTPSARGTDRQCTLIQDSTVDHGNLEPSVPMGNVPISTDSIVRTHCRIASNGTAPVMWGPGAATGDNDRYYLNGDIQWHVTSPTVLSEQHFAAKLRLAGTRRWLFDALRDRGMPNGITYGPLPAWKAPQIVSPVSGVVSR